MGAFAEGFEFDYMTRRPIYQVCPEWLIARCNIGERSTVVDLGCGSGIVTQLLLERFKSPEFRVLAIDPSEWELNIARSKITDDRVTFIQGRAQDALNIVDREADAVLLCNVLHQIPRVERGPVLDGAFKLVRPGGFVGANTLFYGGGIEPATRRFYLRWMAEAREALARANVAWTPPKETPVALQHLTPEQHRELFHSLGYEEIVVQELHLEWRVEDWEALSKYSVFIQGACPGVDLALGSLALIEGVRTAYRALDLQTVRRGWLHCSARRPVTEARRQPLSATQAPA